MFIKAENTWTCGCKNWSPPSITRSDLNRLPAECIWRQVATLRAG
jgi:hypothetical protein